MPKTLDPFRFVLISVAGWMNQHQQHAIEYLREENRVLRAQLGNRRLRFTDDQRRGLATKAKLLGRRLLAKVATIATPETLLNWHRKLIANKYDGKRTSHSRSPGNGERAGSAGRPDGHGEPGLGIPSNPRRAVESRPPTGPQHNCQYPETQRRRAGAGTNSEDHMEGVPDQTLDPACGCGLFHNRGLDSKGPPSAFWFCSSLNCPPAAFTLPASRRGRTDYG